METAEYGRLRRRAGPLERWFGGHGLRLPPSRDAGPGASVAPITQSRLLCEIRTPLGLPVVPDVYMRTAVSSGAAAVGVMADLLPAATRSS